MRARHAGFLVFGLATLLVGATAEADQASVEVGIANTGTQTIYGDVNIGIPEEKLESMVLAVLQKDSLNAKEAAELRDQVEKLSKELDVHKPAVENFLRILGERIRGDQDIPAEELPQKLAEIAHRHKAMLERLAVLDPEDPAIAGLIVEAQAAIEGGAYGEADRLLAAAEDAELAAIRMAEELERQAREAAEQRRLNIAAVRAERGELALTRLDYRSAVEHFETAAELVPASAPLVRAGYLNSFGLAAQDAGYYADAEGAHQEAVRLRLAVPGPEHPDLATSLSNLGNLYNYIGRYAEAERLLNDAIDIVEKTLGPEDPSFAVQLSNLASLYQNAGHPARAAPLYEQALMILQNTAGSEPIGATVRGNLATLYVAIKRPAQAMPLFEETLAIDEKMLGPEHPDVAVDLNNLASVYWMQGRPAQAKPLLERALTILEKTLGPEHDRVAINLDNLANVHRAIGRPAEAEPLLKRALSIFEKKLPQNHPDLIIARGNYAGLLDQLGRTDEAAKVRVQAEAGP